jgi:2-methylisocitrate lyase-like PEP mutase family enzyme
VKELVKAFNGRLNVAMKMSPDGLNVKQLGEIGVARISVGPQIQFLAMDRYAEAARGILESM